MNKLSLYIFDPESPSEDYMEIPLEIDGNEYSVRDYVFFAAEEGGVAITFSIDKTNLNYSIVVSEDGKHKVSLLGNKVNLESSDPVVMYTCSGGAVFQVTVKI